MSTSAVIARLDRLPAAALLTDTVVIARRNLTRTRRTPQTAVAAVTSPVLFLILMRLVFAGAIHVPAMTYTDYLVPAMLVQNVIFGGMQSATGLALDVNAGLMDRFRSLPTPASAPLAGRSLSDLALQLLATGLAIAAGLAVGFRFHAGALSCLLGAGLLILISLSLFWLFAALGISTQNPETIQFDHTDLLLVPVRLQRVHPSRHPAALAPGLRSQPAGQHLQQCPPGIDPGTRRGTRPRARHHLSRRRSHRVVRRDRCRLRRNHPPSLQANVTCHQPTAALARHRSPPSESTKGNPHEGSLDTPHSEPPPVPPRMGKSAPPHAGRQTAQHEPLATPEGRQYRILITTNTAARPGRVARLTRRHSVRLVDGCPR